MLPLFSSVCNCLLSVASLVAPQALQGHVESANMVVVTPSKQTISASMIDDGSHFDEVSIPSFSFLSIVLMFHSSKKMASMGHKSKLRLPAYIT